MGEGGRSSQGLLIGQPIQQKCQVPASTRDPASNKQAGEQ